MKEGKLTEAARKQMDIELAEIAKFYMHIETLEERKNDSLDFHEVGVWNVKAALEAAYKAGKEAGR